MNNYLLSNPHWISLIYKFILYLDHFLEHKRLCPTELLGQRVGAYKCYFCNTFSEIRYYNLKNTN